MARTAALLAALPLALLCASVGSEAAAGAAGASQKSVAAVQKVISMLQDMSSTTKQKKNEDEVAYGKFTVWCGQEKEELTKEIAKNTEQIELLGTEIAKLDSEVKELGGALADLSDKVAKDQANIKAETAQREKDHEAFLAEQQDYSESVDALDRAIRVLEKQSYDRPALLQVASEEPLPAKARAIVAAFIGMMDGKDKEDPNFMNYQAPEANAYEFQSGSIVDLLKKLKDEFSSKLGTCQKEEMNSKHAFDMTVEDLADSVENAEKESEAKTVEKQRKAEEAAQNQKDLAATVTMKSENEGTMKAVTTECEEKTFSFEEKQKLRTEEIEAIAKAVEILSSPEVAGTAEKYLALAQSKPAAAALVQLDGSQEQRGGGGAVALRVAGIRRKLREFLASEGSRLRSQRLGVLAQQASADPFAKVKKLIDAMITRLLEEAKEDADHEGFCDTEMGKSKITRTKLSEEIDGLSAAVDEGKSQILKLAEETSTLTAEVEELVKSMADAANLREEEKKKNAETVKDAEAAQAAVAAATAVLKDFYEKASTATALVQAKAPEERKWGLKTGVKMGSEEWDSLAPGAKPVDTGHKEGMQTFGEVDQGSQDAADGVLGLLEVVQTDFANLAADTKASETESQTSYENFMAECKKSQAVKEKNIDMNNSDKAAAESKLQEDLADLKSSQDELLAADRYHAKLAPQCIDQGMSFEERTAARAAELASLKQALQILSGEDIA